MKKLVYILFGMLLLSRCIDPLDLEGIVDGQPQLVVDAYLSDQPETYFVYLSYSSTSLKGYEDEDITGAEVFVTDQEGNRFDFRDAGSGTYESDPFGFQGQIGQTYQLHIRLPDGKEYTSREETIQPVPEIDSIYARHENRPSITAIGSVIDNWGMQTYVTTGSGGDEPGFYRWDWRETYEFQSPLFDPMSITPPPICYQSGSTVRNLNIASSADFSEDKIVGHPINFISKNTYKLQIRYSLLVTQYSLTERAYTFWENVKTQDESGGSVFAPPPSPIPGNIYNVNDDTETVLGVFQVSAVRRKRFFLPRSEVPARPGGPPSGFGECGPGVDEIPEYCYDCSLMRGVTTERPPFW